MKRISLERLVSAKGELSYSQQYEYVTELIKKGKIKRSEEHTSELQSPS